MTEVGICHFMELFVSDRKFQWPHKWQTLPNISNQFYGIFGQFLEYSGKRQILELFEIIFRKGIAEMLQHILSWDVTNDVKSCAAHAA